MKAKLALDDFIESGNPDKLKALTDDEIRSFVVTEFGERIAEKDEEISKLEGHIEKLRAMLSTEQQNLEYLVYVSEKSYREKLSATIEVNRYKSERDFEVRKRAEEKQC